VATDIGPHLRAEVARRAESRCEYCLIRDEDSAFPHQVDHVVRRKHGGLSELENLAYCCVVCNRLKGTDVASIDMKSGAVIRLFHPRKDRWEEHFRVDGALIDPVTSIGEATARILRLNIAARVAERRVLASLGRYP
jgi:hypothetical protein